MKKRPDLKNKILELINQGVSFRQIAKILKCSTGSICYHTREDQKIKSKLRKRKYDKSSHPFKRKIFLYSREYDKKINLKTTNATVEKLIGLKILKFSFNKVEKVQEKPLFTIDDVIKKFEQNPRCYLTGDYIDINKPRTYQFDHIIPRSRGGDNSLDNLGICTKNANMAKTDMMLDEFIELCKKVVKMHGDKN